jgi:hypothetical protein
LILLNAATIARDVCQRAAGLSTKGGGGEGWQRYRRVYMVQPRRQTRFAKPAVVKDKTQ